MPTIHNDSTESSKKRKREDDAAPPPKKKKSNRSKRGRNKSSRESGPLATPVAQQAISDDTTLDKQIQRVKGKNKATQKNEQPKESAEEPELVNQENGLSKKEKKKRKKEAKKLARRNQAQVTTFKDSDVSGKNGLDNAKSPKDLQPTTQSKAERKAARKSHRGSTEDSSKQAIERELNPEVSNSILARHSSPGWSLSPPSAGRFLDHDPIFVQSEDSEDFLITANDREVQLLSLETSLVIRTHTTPAGLSVLSYAMDSSQDDIVHISYSDETVFKWNWADGSARKDFTASGTVKAMATVPSADHTQSRLFYINALGQETAIFNQDKSLHVTRQPLQSIQILGNAEYVVARAPSGLVLGMRKEQDESMTDFIWIELPLTAKCTCFDARLLPIPSPTKKSAKQRPGFSLAVGNEDGQIHLYEDVSSIFKQHGQQRLPRPRILHWHREAVSSVKFGRDGNYLISGGRETVLVLWQLETGKKQFLPHLTSEIERIVVNPEGDRYALQMGDNSIMVLSTSELKPVANFAGLQTLCRNQGMVNIAPPAPAATLHSNQPHQLLLSVPATQPKSATDISARPFLQAFDIRTARHITRQALTRNNVTDFNLGPERTSIIPPDIKHLAISQDGSWLATTDEWEPPTSDLEHLATDYTSLQTQRQQRREVYLKFWSWNEGQGLWTLTTRVDSPHALSSGDSTGAGKVLGLVPNSATNGFATIGEDSCVKIWTPKTRTRHGVALKDKTNADLVEWTCKQTVPLVKDKERADSPLGLWESFASLKASLSYSADGSMLAAVQSTLDPAESPLIHFINTTTGEVIPKTGLAPSEISAIGFLDRYFVAVSSPAVYVWDLVNDTLIYKIKLPSSEAFDSHKEPLLAVNDGDGTFAVVTHREEGGKSKVEVYGGRESNCLYKQNFDTQVETVLAGKGARGYTLLFVDATIRTLSPAATTHGRMSQPQARLTELQPAQVETPPEPSAREPDVEMEDELPSAEANGSKTDRLVLEDSEEDRPVVRPEQLASVFDTAQSYAMPPVKDMFQAVVGLFGRQRYVKPQAEVA